MQNVKTSSDGKTLTIIVDLTKPPTPSASGKTLVIASTRGNQEVVEGVFLGLNLYRYRNSK